LAIAFEMTGTGCTLSDRLKHQSPKRRLG
jgi:hypothetical protein